MSDDEKRPFLSVVGGKDTTEADKPKDPEYKKYRVVLKPLYQDEEPIELIYEGFLMVTPTFIAIGTGDGSPTFASEFNNVFYVETITS